ncbi:MAG: carbohydrate kinase [Pirellulales bacterium]
MTTSETPTIVGLGEVLWDCFGNSRRPGGAPANVAFHAQQLGGRGVVCSRVGNDALGEELISHLAGHGLATEFIQHDAHHPTGTVTVDSTDADAPRFTIHTGVAWDHLAFDAPLAQLAREARAVCFGTLAQRSHVTRDTIRQFVDCVDDDCLRVFDVNMREQWYDRESIEWSLAHADLAKLNGDEVLRLGALFEIDGDGVAEVAAGLGERLAVPVVCVTRGGEGCLLIGDGETCDGPSDEIEVVDAVGAGDAFTAALVSARLAGWPLERSGRFANDVGRLVVRHEGAMPDLCEEFAQLKQCYAEV